MFTIAGSCAADLHARIVEEEHAKLLRDSNLDVHEDSKLTTLPVSRAILAAYVNSDVKPPWAIDLWSLNFLDHDIDVARARIRRYLSTLAQENTQIMENLDFGVAP